MEAFAVILKGFYQAFRGELVSVSEEVAQLAEEYNVEGKRLGLNTQKMYPDLVIVASAVTAGVDLVLTLNRETMASDLARLVYVIVNERKGLNTPQFITERAVIKKLSDV